MRILTCASLACFFILTVERRGVTGYRWEDKDTIIIEAEEEESSKSTSRSKRQYELNELYFGGPFYGVGNNNNHHSNNGQCLTTNGELGVCAALSDCYPVLYTLPAIRGERNITNNPLAQDLLRASGPCSNNPLDFMDNIICCPTLFRRTRNPTKPKYPQQQHREVPTPPNCGVTKVVGSKEAIRGTFPWIAALMINGRQFCGGSLIDDYHVITAAHCVSHLNGNGVNNLRVLLGAHDLYSALERGRVSASAARVLYHRGFSHQTLLYDIAVIRLSQPVRYWNYDNINAICLTTGKPPYDQNWPGARLAGWGKLSDRGPVPSRLQDVFLKVWPNDVCRRHYGRIPRGGIQDHNVCASAGYGGGGQPKDACQGDSGGPLMRFANSRVEQIGIVSWGVNCGERSFPGVYTRVDYFKDWLNKNRLS